MIHAIKDGVSGTFSLQSWELLGKNKHGWVEVVKTPAIPEEIEMFLRSKEIKKTPVDPDAEPETRGGYMEYFDKKGIEYPKNAKLSTLKELYDDNREQEDGDDPIN